MFGYGVEPPSERHGDPLDKQEAACKAVFDRLKAEGQLCNNTLWGGFFGDHAPEAVIRAFWRPAFGEFLIRRRRGDMLIVSNLSLLGKSMADIAITLRSLDESGVTVHVASFDHAITGWENGWIRAMFQEMVNASYRMAKAHHEVNLIYKNKLKPRKAPLGWQWKKFGKSRYLIPNAKDREFGRKVIQWRDEEKLTFVEIGRRLKKMDYRQPRKGHAHGGYTPRNGYGKWVSVNHVKPRRLYIAAKHGFPPLSSRSLAARYAREKSEACDRAYQAQLPATLAALSVISDTGRQVPGRLPSSLP